jgi:hypothetical protein
MFQFTIAKGLNVSSTTFTNKHIHKQTWYSADGRTVNQLDHVLISIRFRSTITDIRALRGPDSRSDHNLLKITVNVKLKVKPAIKYSGKKLCILFKIQIGNKNKL